MISKKYPLGTMRPHRKLIAWQESIQFAKDIYLLARLLPSEEKFGLTSQMRRAVVSISLNIAEGAARQSEKEFIRFLFFSEGSCSEIDTLLEICKILEYFPEEKLEFYINKNEKISALVMGLRKSLERKIGR
ncbi:MAG: four helix bundle protein [Bacteroidetes bacterium]|nr:four helix bundle protein [Bacteroidota bacterium]